MSKLIMSTEMKELNSKLSEELETAIGYDSISQFATKCRITDVNLLNDIYDCRLNSLPPRELLRRIADNSKGRVTYRKLYDICGYSEMDEEEDRSWMDIKPIKGDVFYADLGFYNFDQEQNGHRTVVVISNNVGNSNGSILLVAPTTSKWKKLMPTHVNLTQEDGMRENSILMLEQCRCISKRRLYYSGFPIKVASLNDNKMFEVDTAIEKAFGIIDVMFNDNKVIALIDQIKALQYNIEVKQSKDLINLLNEKADEFEKYCFKYYKNPDAIWNTYNRINVQYA